MKISDRLHLYMHTTSRFSFGAVEKSSSVTMLMNAQMDSHDSVMWIDVSVQTKVNFGYEFLYFNVVQLR